MTLPFWLSRPVRAANRSAVAAVTFITDNVHRVRSSAVDVVAIFVVGTSHDERPTRCACHVWFEGIGTKSRISRCISGCVQWIKARHTATFLKAKKLPLQVMFPESLPAGLSPFGPQLIAPPAVFLNPSAHVSSQLCLPCSAFRRPTHEPSLEWLPKSVRFALVTSHCCSACSHQYHGVSVAWCSCESVYEHPSNWACARQGQVCAEKSVHSRRGAMALGAFVILRTCTYRHISLMSPLQRQFHLQFVRR